MLIILEGPDGSGKSTLAAALGEHITVHHGPYLDVKASGDLARIYLRSMQPALKGDDAVLDRSWISEQAYGPVMRGNNRLQTSHRRMLERVALAAGGVVVLCLPPFETCLKTYAMRKGQEYVSNEGRLKEIYLNYGTVGLGGTALPVILYDRTQESPQAMASNVLQFADQHRNLGPGGGHWNPGKVCLIVGDRANTKQHHDGPLRVPFVAFQGLGCSEWLADRLEEGGISENELYWVNAYDNDGSPLMASFINDLRPTKIVALGRRAAEWLDGRVAFDQKVYEVPHPQHHKRFHFGKPYPMVGALA